MGQVSLAAHVWLKHLAPLVELKDLVIHYGEGNFHYKVAYATYYYEVSQENVAGIQGAGSLTFSDIPKAVTFLKKSKGENVTIKQGRGNRLTLQCGNKKMTMPCMDSITAQRVPTFSNLVNVAQQNNWESFSNSVLNAHGSIVMNDILDIASMGKLISSDADYEVKMNPLESEFAVKAFKTNSTSLFVSTELKNPVGGNNTVMSSFGSWLLPCLNFMDKDIDTEVHFGAATVLVLQQPNKLLVVIDQE